MLSRVSTATLRGIDADILSVEADMSAGIPGWQMVGLPEQVVKESKDRVAAALRNSGYSFPARKIIINFSPADYKKRGSGFDLPIAVALMSAHGFIPDENLSGYIFTAELSLTGRLLPVSGVLAMAVEAKKRNLDGLVVPEANYHEASLVRDVDVIGCDDLSQVVHFLKNGKRPLIKERKENGSKKNRSYDLFDVKGQHVAKRALEIAAAGGHNILMLGPPGSGKTMLAERLPSIMPPLSTEESLSTTKIYSAMGILDPQAPLMCERPFRAPHHSASTAGLFGGGSGVPTIGEISLAHNGVLFLDEFPEFRKDVIEVLRQPLESGVVRITRAGYRVTYPARFLLAAAMNPCRCGYLGHPIKSCICSVLQIQSYRRKLSGPLLDRIDLRIEVPQLKSHEITGNSDRENSKEVRKRVIEAREMQKNRYQGCGASYNAELSPALLKRFCVMNGECKKLLNLAVESKGYSARSIDRVIRVARTIADLDKEETVKISHVAEAVQHHRLDRLDYF